ncbi:MAG: hypothetical protein MJB14_01990 [Spirochaetes bacterium]|nr:hypothetical protein [Spirochaetota bacterium]
MNKCLEYEKYFFDYIDEQLSSNKEKDFLEHLKNCNFCQDQLEQHKKYSQLIAKTHLENPVAQELTVRLNKRIAGLKVQREQNILLKELGLISLQQLVEILSLTDHQLEELKQSSAIIRIRQEFYIKKGAAKDLLIKILESNQQQVNSELLKDSDLMRNFNFSEYNKYFLARDIIKPNSDDLLH